MVKKAVLIALSILWVQSAFGMSLYVDPNNGSDSTSRSNNNIESPWRSVRHAFYNAQAGDVVYFRGGNYNVEFVDLCTNGYHGSSNAWIEFTSYQNEEVRWIAASVGAYGQLFNMGKNYHYIHNIDINGNNIANRIFLVGYDCSVTGFRVEHCTISNWANGDNSAAFYLGSNWAAVTASNLIVKNNVLTGRGPTANYQNYDGIVTFGAASYQIENNEIGYVVRGIYLKHSSRDYSNTGKTCKFNWIHDQHIDQRGFHGAGIAINDNYVTVSHNIVHHGITVGEDAQSGSGSPRGNYNVIEHNTSMLYGFQWEYPSSGDGLYNTVRNNLFSSATARSTNIFSFNLYRNSGAIGQSDLGNTSPVFTGGSSPSTISGWMLVNGSAGTQNADDGTDRGAHTPSVGTGGVSAGGNSAIIPPASPLNVRIIN
jgi:hypothetical protein